MPAMLWIAAAGVLPLGVAVPEDCQLNGELVAAKCVCDKGWKGPSCGDLDLESEPTISYGYGSPADPTTSSWGGGPPAYDPLTGQYHLFVTELAGHCGMGVWARMSQAAHAVSHSPLGPFKRTGLAIPSESHNIFYAYSPTDEMHLIYHIFSGTSPESCNPYFKGCTDGTTPRTTGGVRPRHWQPAETCKGEGGTHVHYSKSLEGPWLSAGPLKTDTTGCLGCGDSNPAPWIFPNGTVLMLGRSKDVTRNPGEKAIFGHNLWLYRAPSWNATYEWVPGHGVNGTVNIGNGTRADLTEDPVLWQGRRGFHALMHSDDDLTHAWSVDGLGWNFSSVHIGPPPMPGGANERPRVVVDKMGDLSAVIVAQLVVNGSDASRTASYRVNSR
jgi:hypothetical protein